MKNLSLKWHVCITFSIIAVIPVLFINLLQITGYGIIFVLLPMLLLGYIYAIRISSTISLLMDYIEKVISGNCSEGQMVSFPKFAPYEFALLARHFCIMAKKIKDGQQALRELNTDLEKRVAERTQHLLRNNCELAILNQLITPNPGVTSTIEGCLNEFLAIAGVKVVMYLTKPVISLVGSYADALKNTAALDSNHHKNSHRYYIQPIRSGKTTFGHFVVPNSPMTDADRRFLQTLSDYAGVNFQNEILSLTLRQNNAVLKAVLESMYDAIVLIDNRQKLVYANGRMAKMLNIPYDQLRGSTEEYLFARIADMLIDANQELLKEIRQKYGIYKLKVKLGSKQERFKLLSVFPVTDDEHNTIGKGYLLRDITKEQEVNKLKNDLISLVSHEFKTPITSIKGSVETLLRRDTDWDEEFKQELLTGIHEDIGHIQELVNDWLDLSRIDARAIGLNREAIRPHAIVDGAIRKLPKHFSSGAVIASTVSENMALIYGDRVRLEQVMANLLTNAIRYNDCKPHIEITAASDEKYVHISVKDNGIGINQQYLEKVFDRFFCIDTGWVRRTGGTGLGLAICKGILEAHGGRIRAESNEGVGSVFTVSIPQYR